MPADTSQCKVMQSCAGPELVSSSRSYEAQGMRSASGCRQERSAEAQGMCVAACAGTLMHAACNHNASVVHEDINLPVLQHLLGKRVDFSCVQQVKRIHLTVCCSLRLAAVSHLQKCNTCAMSTFSCTPMLGKCCRIMHKINCMDTCAAATFCVLLP